MSKANDKLKVYALGGLGEIGKNMYVFEYGEDIIVIDTGLKFPEEDLLGIDLVIPDSSYLIDNKDKVKAVLLTHGHEDHIGGLHYFLKEINVPVYGTKLTLGFVESKLKEAQILNQSKLVLINSDSILNIGVFKVSFFRTNHSVPDSVGIALETPEGVIVHSGDFKFDFTPVDNQLPEINKLAEIGKKGVLLLLSDSTNAEREGYTHSERSVRESLNEVFRKANQRIIVATFASNIHRIQQIVDAAIEHERKIAIVGRSMVNVVNIGTDLGYLHIPNNMIIEVEDIKKIPAEKVVILCTGSQGEPMSALTRMARSNHRQIEILSGDTVILAATPIPGNEKNVSRTVDQLFRIGAKVIYGPNSLSKVHVSGHASQEELKLMLTLLKPRYFIPIHGEYRMLKLHSDLAETMGVLKENIFVMDNGDTVEISDGIARLGPKVPVGIVLIDGLGVGDVGNIVLRDRRLLSQDGILVVVVTLSKQSPKILAGPDIISRGFVYVRESEELLDEANRIVTATLQKLMGENINEWSSLKTGVREALGKFLYEKTRRRPMILPIIMEA
ncbi:MAG: ribonuclease J [Vulcanibacillus sp.]